MHAEPIRVLHLYPKLERKLVALLRSLRPEQWSQQVLPQWTVKDVAAHLLDGNLRRLSIARDGFSGEKFTGGSNTELIAFLNGLNADWVKAFRRISPRVLIELLELTTPKVLKYFASLDPDADATFPVAWAGHSASPHWFDIAREYTERWHHQQQIREAINQPGIMTRQFYHPVLDAFMHAFPPAYKSVPAENGTTVSIRVTGKSGGRWFIKKDAEWALSDKPQGAATTEVVIPEAFAWKLFARALSPDFVATHIKVSGERSLAEPLYRVVAVMK